MSSRPRKGPSLRDIVGEDIRVVQSRQSIVEAPKAEPDPALDRDSEPVHRTVKPPTRGQGTLKERAHQFSTYLEPPIYDALRDIAHAERVKIHALMLEGVDAVLKKRGMPSIAKILSSGHDSVKVGS